MNLNQTECRALKVLRRGGQRRRDLTRLCRLADPLIYGTIAVLISVERFISVSKTRFSS